MNDIPNIPSQLLSNFTGKQAWHYRVIPYKQLQEILYLYTDIKTGLNSLKDELELLTGKKILLESTDETSLQELLEKYYSRSRADDRQQASYYQGHADAFLGHLISEAKNLGSSDIHIEIYEEMCRVRIRIDGMLVQRYLLDRKQYPPLSTRSRLQPIWILRKKIAAGWAHLL